MRALFLRTHTQDCEKFWLSMQCIGVQISTLQYDDRPHERHQELLDAAKEINPDVIVFLGALEQYHLKPVPKPDILAKFRLIAPVIHICSDASDWPWWETLDLYDKEACFDLQVNVDGSYECPIAGFKNGLIKLTPTDPSFFKPKLWNDREVLCGITGGLGHGDRSDLIVYLTASPMVKWVKNVPYQEMCDFICNTKVSVNHAMNGTGDKFHVKGRVVETGWANACLLERKNPVTAKWFIPGKDYLEYENVRDAIHQLEWVKNHPDDAEAIAATFHSKMWSNHNPAVFWSDVLGKVGLTL